MAVTRPLISFASLVLLAGGILLLFFILLSGGVNSTPVNQFYFLEASNIGNIPNARNPSRWTYFAICGVNPSNGHNANCGSRVPALPFDPPKNFGTGDGVPPQLLGTSYYFYMSRFSWVFFLIALVFGVLGLFTGILALFSRLGGYLSGLTVAIALFFQTLAAALMTAWVVKGRDAFRSNGQDAKIGQKVMGFAWATFACFFIATVLFCCGGLLGGDSSSRGLRRKRSTRSNRSAKNRGSFFETDSQRRAKDEYSV